MFQILYILVNEDNQPISPVMSLDTPITRGGEWPDYFEAACEVLKRLDEDDFETGVRVEAVIGLN